MASKKKIIKLIMDDIKENEYESKELLFDLARERLNSMSKAQICKMFPMSECDE